MKENDEIELHPEVKKLLEEYDNLKNELAKLLEEKEHIIVTVIPEIEAEYKVKIGYLEYKCFVLEIEIRRINREIKIRQASANRGEKIDEIKIKKQLDIEFEVWKKQLEGMKAEIEKANRYLSIPTMTKEQTAELKKLYRNIAKKLHPDINPNICEKDKLLWIRVNEAYKNGDIEELRALSIMAENVEADVELTGKDMIEVLNDKILSIQKSITTVLEQINTLNSKFPLNIKKQLSDDNWVNAKSKEVLEKVEVLTEKKEFLKSVLAEFV